jgi:Ca-activated chloride channel family protein
MSQAIELMSEDEVRRARAGNEDASFGCLKSERGHLPLQAMELTARVVGLAAEVELHQTFVNTTGGPIEATYVFPLPDRSAVTRFRMEVNGRLIEGQLKERGEARRDYDQAIQTGHRAAITEEERPGVFTMRVGNLMPNERARVTLALSGPLPFTDGEATFRFPLVVAPRFIPGQELPGENVGDGVARDTDAVPDASRISPPVLLPGFKNPVSLALSVELDPAGLSIADVRSSLHAVDELSSSGVRRIVVRPGERLDRDFILRFKIGARSVTSSVVTQADGTFLLTMLPPLGARRGRPRDVAFVLDRSGSMAGWKMVAARRAVARMVDSLLEQDRFGVLAFDNAIESPSELTAPLSPASDRNRFRAVEFLAKVEHRGGTEMAEPLERAATALAGGYDDRERVLVLVTDGQVGNEDQILRSLSPKLKNVRVFALGIDQAVNAAFLNRLASLGGGMAELVESEDRLDAVMDRMHRRIGNPLLTEISIDASGIGGEAASLAPARVPDLFEGTPLVVFGRCSHGGEGQVVVRGRDVEGRPFEERLFARRGGHAGIAAMWARAHVRDLEDRLVTGRGGAEALERQIIETSLRFGVLCRFTAFVAVDRSERVNVGGAVHAINQPVEMPAGWAKPAPMAAPLLAGLAGGPPPSPPPPKGAFFAAAKVAAPEQMTRAGNARGLLARASDALGSMRDALGLDLERGVPGGEAPRAAPAAAPPPPARRQENAARYDANSIEVLEGLEAVRRRPGMYVGDNGAEGLHGVLFEVLDQSAAEARAGFAKTLEVELLADGSVRVRDDGRGIPVEWVDRDQKSAAEVILTTLFAGGAPAGSGVGGIGLAVVNALAEWLEVEIERGGRIHFARFERGQRVSPAGTPSAPLSVRGASAKTGTAINWKPDPTIFSTVAFDRERIRARLAELALQGLTVLFHDQRSGRRERLERDASGIERLRRWAAAMLKTLGTMDDLRVLGEAKARVSLQRLGRDLRLLVDDLAKEPGHGAELATLEGLVMELNRGGDALALAERVRSALEAFAQGQGGSRRDSFWKR